MNRRPHLDLSEIVLDCADAQEMAGFYLGLLGGEPGHDEGDWVTMRPAGSELTLAFAAEPTYERPVWPSRTGAQQMMLHLDFEVDDLDEAVAFAVELGAAVAEVQPQRYVRVMLDPAGHPFCLWVDPPDATE